MNSSVVIKMPELQVAVLGLAFNAVWEFAHSPLYADHLGRGLSYLIWTRIHCTIGDVVILLAAFWLTALVQRSRRWIWSRSLWPIALFTVTGLSYTIASEWFHTTVTRTWTYAETMPRIFGIGLTPLLQWLILPPLMAWCLKRIDLRARTTRHPQPAIPANTKNLSSAPPQAERNDAGVTST